MTLTFTYKCPHCPDEIEIVRSPRTGISDNLPERCDHCGELYTEENHSQMLAAYDEYLSDPIEDYPHA